MQYRLGARNRPWIPRISCSQAAFGNHRTCLPANTPELLIPGFNYWDWTQRATARIRYGGRKRRRYTDGPRTCGRCNCYSAIPSLRVQSGTSELKWMTRVKWRSKLTCDDAAPVGGAGRRPAKPGHSTCRVVFQKGDVRLVFDGPRDK